jgi:hypothetical protein
MKWVVLNGAKGYSPPPTATAIPRATVRSIFLSRTHRDVLRGRQLYDGRFEDYEAHLNRI